MIVMTGGAICVRDEMALGRRNGAQQSLLVRAEAIK